MHQPGTLNSASSDAAPIRTVLSWDYFRTEGISVASWAKERGFNERLVRAILRGERKCLRGESAKIAKELGLK
ncbi:hypothetical protein [Delftia tsuruhatensis]|uniref:hypothetical protein n=1 Tax=Delftia tsuruhatensis TaxID=180282 RepID=UPI0020917173|nr:hypothetical protein [Delftia tsuruhatensis]MCO5337585.1 hypothetical protein [Delftia tsuruhatensis]MCR4548250.1 hypothetical protein [Delftia tsuruhatensis]